MLFYNKHVPVNQLITSAVTERFMLVTKVSVEYTTSILKTEGLRL